MLRKLFSYGTGFLPPRANGTIERHRTNVIVASDKIVAQPFWWMKNPTSEHSARPAIHRPLERMMRNVGVHT